MSRARSWPMAAGAWLVVAAALLASGCPAEDEAGVAARRTPGTNGAPSPTPSGAVGGGIEPGGVGVPTVRTVLVEPASQSLNAPAADGSAPGGLGTTATCSARVTLSNGEADPQGVSWSVSEAAQARVDAAGRVTVQPGAPAGTIAVIATSLRDSRVKAQGYVQVTTDGLLRLTVQPTPDPLAQDVEQTTLNVVRQADGGFVRLVNLAPLTDIRLPAGTYAAQVERTFVGSPSVRVPLASFTITPNGLLATTSILP